MKSAFQSLCFEGCFCLDLSISPAMDVPLEIWKYVPDLVEPGNRMRRQFVRNDLKKCAIEARNANTVEQSEAGVVKTLESRICGLTENNACKHVPTIASYTQSTQYVIYSHASMCPL